MPGDPLKIGVMLDSPIVPAWVGKILADVARADFLELAVVILNGEKRDASFVQQWPWLLFLLYERLDQWLFSWRHHNAFAPTDISENLGGAKVLKVLPSRDKSCHRFAAADVEWIKGQGLDVILKLGFNGLTGEILSSASYGVWSLHHGDPREYRGEPALFWEIYEGSPVSGSSLQILTQEPVGGKEIYRSLSSTHMYSLFRNRNLTYWKTADFMMRRLKTLHWGGWDSICSLETCNEAVRGAKQVYRTPTNREMISYLAKVCTRFARERYSLLRYHDHWLIGFRKRNFADVANIDLASAPFTLVRSPAESYFADPFVVGERGHNTIFFEQYQRPLKRGSISYIEVDDEGNVSKPNLALQRDYHLAYPMVFRWQESYFMIPETRQNRSIELYRATDYPTRWKLEKVLFDHVQAVDTTLFEHGGRFWLFTNMSVSGGSTWDELFLFHSDSPLGEWIPHPNNPIVSDVRRARPAGKLFWLNGVLYRPSQESSLRYGYGVNLNRVDVLSENEYMETPVKLLEPDWLAGNLKTHTFNFNEDLEIVDAMIMVKKPIWRG